jgi:iron complex outermembrane receptor protein
MTGDKMQSKGIFDTNDLRGHIPNLQTNSPWGDSQPNFNLRSVGAGNQFNANAASPIGVYFGEVYEGFSAAQGAQFFDIEYIEVVKAPKVLLYERNTSGGAINIPGN